MPHRNFHKPLPAAALACFFACSAAVWGQITVTSPASRDVVRAAPDYATEVLADRWDMNQRTDLGWRIFNTIEQPLSNLTGISFSEGIFSAATVPVEYPGYPEYSDPNIYILDSDYTGSAGIGKFGSNSKIDADKYTVFAVRMSIPGPLDVALRFGQIMWSENTIFHGTSQSNGFLVGPGWGIYLIDLPTLGVLSGTAWTGLKDSLRLDPMSQRDKTIQIDWIRLVQNGSAYQRTISWTGTGGMDIALDNDPDPANGNLGVLARDVTGGTYAFVAGGLAAGRYYVAIAPRGTLNWAYSTGYYEVEEQPIFRIDSPSAEGSDQDFMTVVAGNPWDMNALSDVDHTVNLASQSIRTIDYEDLAGNIFTGNQVYYGTAAIPPDLIGDPTVFFLNFFYRGKTYQIDTARYHNLVAKMGIAGVHSTNDGSVARVMYMRTDEHAVGENVSQDIIIRHTPRPGDRWVMHKIVADLRTLPLEDGAASPSHSGWTGIVDTFRIDPYEFPDGRGFFFDDVRLTADWRVDSSFVIEWTMEDADSATGATVSFYYDTDRSGYDGTLIESGISAPAGTGSTIWDTASVPGGTYYLYAVVTDGNNSNRFYATGPVIVDHAGMPVIALSKTAFAFGAIQNGIAGPAETTTLTNTGTGTLNWTAVRSADWISVTPSSGTGNGLVSIGIARTNLSLGTYQGTVMISDPDAVNSPQVIHVTYNVYGSGGDGEPFGLFETPVDGATVASSVPVTGWVLDDIGMQSVRIYRGTDISDRVYIGEAMFVEGARPDIAAAYPGYPQNSRAGWGYMLLTNFLPDGGNGNFTLLAYATDLTGHEVLLGTKAIFCDNANAVRPFGAIDTPAQGGTASGGTFFNFGWALTPMPKSIPVNGSTINVWVDGAPLGHPSYGYYRADIADLFPGYANSNGAIGVYSLNTTLYEDGIHTIVWSVVDSAGQADGIGSRYFSVLNLSGAQSAPGGAAGSASAAGGVADAAGARGTAGVRSKSSYAQVSGMMGVNGAASLPGGAGGSARAYEAAGRMKASLEGMWNDTRSPVYVRRGMAMDAPVELATPENDGSIRIAIPEVTRVAVYLNEAAAGETETEMIERGARMLLKRGAEKSARYEAFEMALGELRPLPIGASFDPVDGVLYWQPGPGFLGEYTFVVVDRRTLTKKTIGVSIRSR